MNDDPASFVARVICLYLEHPDTPDIPSSADWDIAHDLHHRGIPLDTVRLAFQLAFVRRRARCCVSRPRAGRVSPVMAEGCELPRFA